MKVGTILITLYLVLVAGLHPCSAATPAAKMNFHDRRALVVNSCPYLELSEFAFQNSYQARGLVFTQDLKWKNVGSQPLIAAEVVVLKYDPFDRRLAPSRWIITGKNSADWTPLQPNESNGDGSQGYGTENVLTAIAYVRAARLQDGTVWVVDPSQLEKELRKIAPAVREFGSLEPDPEPPVPR